MGMIARNSIADPQPVPVEGVTRNIFWPILLLRLLGRLLRAGLSWEAYDQQEFISTYRVETIGHVTPVSLSVRRYVAQTTYFLSVMTF